CPHGIHGLFALDGTEPRADDGEHTLDRGHPLGDPLEVVSLAVTLDPANAQDPTESHQNRGGNANLAVLAGGNADPVPRRTTDARSSAHQTETALRVEEAGGPGAIQTFVASGRQVPTP